MGLGYHIFLSCRSKLRIAKYYGLWITQEDICKVKVTSTILIKNMYTLWLYIEYSHDSTNEISEDILRHLRYSNFAHIFEEQKEKVYPLHCTKVNFIRKIKFRFKKFLDGVRRVPFMHTRNSSKWIFATDINEIEFLIDFERLNIALALNNKGTWVSLQSYVILSCNYTQCNGLQKFFLSRIIYVNHC